MNYRKTPSRIWGILEGDILCLLVEEGQLAWFLFQKDGCKYWEQRNHRYPDVFTKARAISEKTAYDFEKDIPPLPREAIEILIH